MPENQRRVLILEDEPVISRVLGRIMKADDFTVDIAENGQVAMEKIEAGTKYDLCIFDIRTPVINGMQLYEYIRETTPELTEKVTFITGDFLNLATGEFLERVKRPYLAKPFTPDQIRELIRGVIKTEALTV